MSPEITDTPSGPQHTGNYLLVTRARFDHEHKIHLDFAPPRYSVDEVVIWANYFDKHGDKSGREKYYKNDTVESTLQK